MLKNKQIMHILLLPLEEEKYLFEFMSNNEITSFI